MSKERSIVTSKVGTKIRKRLEKMAKIEDRSISYLIRRELNKSLFPKEEGD